MLSIDVECPSQLCANYQYYMAGPQVLVRLFYQSAWEIRLTLLE